MSINCQSVYLGNDQGYVYCFGPGTPIQKTVNQSEDYNTRLELQNEVEELTSLALDFFKKYPWQNIRAIRAFAPLPSQEERPLAERLKDTKLPSEIIPDLIRLHDAIQNKKGGIFSSGDSISFQCKTDPLLSDLSKIADARNFWEIILWAYERSNPQIKSVTYALPDGSGLNSYTAMIDPKHVALAKAVRLLAGFNVNFKTISTSITETDLEKSGWIIKTLLDIYPHQPANKKIATFDYYLDVYETPKDIEVPGLNSLESEINKVFEQKVEMPYKIWIADWFVSTPDAHGPTAKLDIFYADRFVNLRKQKRIFQFLKLHEQAYVNAARIFNSNHPEIKPENIQAFLAANTFGELFWAKQEDPWQDRAAADWYNSPWKQRYDEEYERYVEEKGATFGFFFKDKVYEFPWRIASLLKVPIESQAFGPNQVTIGLLMEAGKSGNLALWKDYFPDRELSVKTAVSIALDPDLSVYAMAMIYDYHQVLFKKSVLKDPFMKFPDDVYPSIKDNAESREFNLLNISGFFDAWPESSKNFPNYFAYAHYSWNLNFTGEFMLLMQRILGTKKGFKSIEMSFMPSAGFKKYDWQAPAPDFTDEKSVLVVLTPSQKRNGPDGI